MISVEIKLLSAVTDEETNLGLMIIDLQSLNSTKTKGNYRCRMYRKGTKLEKLPDRKGWSLSGSKPLREAVVLDHNRLSEPVQNLVTKALIALGYK